MNKGLWIWPASPRGQARVLKAVSESEHLMAALQALAKSANGLSNTGLDEVIGDNSDWITLWVIRQLASLGFVDYKVDYFGNSAVYRLSDLGRSALQRITGKPVAPQKPMAAVPTPKPAPQPS